MQKKFRVNLSQHKDSLKKSMSKIENSVIKDVVDDMVGNQEGGSAWLKAHGDVSWSKGGNSPLEPIK